MKPYKIDVPSFPSAEVAPLRTHDANALAEIVATLKPPFSDALRAELIVLALAHGHPVVKKKATAQMKHVPEFADFKAAYKNLVTQQQHGIDERVHAFPHPLRLDVARGLLFHRSSAGAIVFEEDPQIRGAMLDAAIVIAERAGSTILELDTIYWRVDEGGGSHGTRVRIDKIPPELFAELAARRGRYAFDGLRFHACNLTSLPDEIATADWLVSLALPWNPITEWPQVLAKLPKLRSLALFGTSFTDLPDDITQLTALRELDLGNMKTMKSIPASVCKLDKLEWLRIGNGSINKVPDEIVNMTSLRYLELANAKVTKLPKRITEMKQLKIVGIDGTKVDDATKAALREAGLVSDD